MDEDKIATQKLVIGFMIAFGALLTSAIGFLIGTYGIGKNTTLAVIGWALAVLGLLEALFVKKLVSLLFIMRRKSGDDHPKE